MTNTQEHLLELLKEIDDICQKYGIEYYLGGGTLVGAIRHGGFLPWDDDADLHMSRENAFRFLDAVKQENRPNRTVCTIAKDGTYGNVHWRYQNTATTTLLRGAIGSTSEQGQFIDLFINYPLPIDPEQARRCLENCELYIELKAQNYTITSVLNRSNEYFDRYARAKRFEKIFGKRKVLEYLYKKTFCFPEDEAEDWFIKAPFPPKRVTSKALWGKPRRVKFENLELSVAEHAEKLLCEQYGPAWFEVPAHIDRGEHVFGIDFDVPYYVYTAEYDKHLDVKKFYNFEVAKKEYWFSMLKDRNTVNPHIHYLRGRQIVMEIIQNVETNQIDLQELLKEKHRKELEIIFAPYVDYLSRETSRYWGIYVDMPDEYLYAAFYFSCFDGNYGLAKKVLGKRREDESQELPQYLSELCEICDATDELLTELYGNLNYDAAEKIVGQWLERYPNLLYFLRAKMFLNIRKMEDSEAEKLLEQCEMYLGKYKNDGELLKYKGDLLLRLNRVKEAEMCYRMAFNRLRNGYCLTDIKNYFKRKAAEV